MPDPNPEEVAFGGVFRSILKSTDSDPVTGPAGTIPADLSGLVHALDTATGIGSLGPAIGQPTARIIDAVPDDIFEIAPAASVAPADHVEAATFDRTAGADPAVLHADAVVHSHSASAPDITIAEPAAQHQTEAHNPEAHAAEVHTTDGDAAA